MSVADTMIRCLEDGAEPCFVAVRTCAQTLTEAECEVPSWTLLATIEQRVLRQENSARKNFPLSAPRHKCVERQVRG